MYEYVYILVTGHDHKWYYDKNKQKQSHAHQFKVHVNCQNLKQMCPSTFPTLLRILQCPRRSPTPR